MQRLLGCDRPCAQEDRRYVPRGLIAQTSCSAGFKSSLRDTDVQPTRYARNSLRIAPSARRPVPFPTGVTSHDISLEKQEVLVKATIPYDDVLAKIKKTGKEVKGGKVVD